MKIRIISLAAILSISAACLTHAETGLALNEKQHFELLGALFQDPSKKDLFDSEAMAFLQKYPKSYYRNRTEYMMALDLYNTKGSTLLFDKFCKNKNADQLLSASSLLMMSQLSLSQKNYVKTEEYFKILLKRIDSSYFTREVLYGRALIQMGLNKWDKASKTIKKLTKDNPTFAKEDKIVYSEGYILYKQGKYTDASDKFKTLKSANALYYYGKCLEKMKKYIPAAILYKQLINQYPLVSFKDKAQYSLAECFYLSEDYASALAEFNIFISMFPKSLWSVSANYKIGCCYYNMKAYPKAAEIFTAIAKNSLTSGLAPCAQYMVGESMIAQGNVDAALVAYEELATNFSESLSMRKGLYKIGWCYTLKNNQDQAISAFSTLVSKYPNDNYAPYALFLIAENYRRKNDLFTCIQYYQKVISDPLRTTDLLDAAVFMAVKTFYEQKKYDSIVSNFYYIINGLPEHHSEMTPYTRLLIAEAYYYLGLYTESLKNYDNVITNYPFGVATTFCREGKAWTYFQIENYKDAMKERVFLRDDWFVSHSDTIKISNEFEIGDIYFNQKKYVEALDVFEKFINDYPASDKIPEALFNAGRCYYKLAYYTNAIELWDKLVASYKTSEFAKEAQGLIGDTYFRLQKYDQVLRSCSNIISEYPGTELAEKAQLRIAQSYYNALDDRKAIEEFEKCIATSRDEETRNTAFEGLLASAYRLNETEPDSDYDIQVLEKNIAAYPKAKQASALQYRVAERYYDKKDYARSAEEFKKVISNFASNENAANALFYRAESLYHGEDYEEAAAAYTRFIDNYPEHESIRIGYLHLANSLFYLEKYEEAAAKYQELTTLGKKEDEIVVTAFFNASLCYKKSEKWDDVISINKQFVARFPKNARAKDALIEIASACEVLNNSEKSSKAYQELFSVLPDTDSMRPEVLYKISKYCIKTGNMKDAAAALEKLLLIQPFDDVWRLSGIAQFAQEYETQKQWVKALKMYQYIVSATTDPKWVTAAQERIDLIQKEMKDSSATQ